MSKQINIDDEHMAKLMFWLAVAPREEINFVAHLPEYKARHDGVTTIVWALTDQAPYLGKKTPQHTAVHLFDHRSYSSAPREWTIGRLVDRGLLPEGWTGEYKLHLVGREEPVMRGSYEPLR